MGVTCKNGYCEVMLEHVGMYYANIRYPSVWPPTAVLAHVLMGTCNSSPILREHLSIHRASIQHYHLAIQQWVWAFVCPTLR